ncbi:MAG: hypothetical protein ACMUHU_01855 [Thermoplasmatota archaeon]
MEAVWKRILLLLLIGVLLTLIVFPIVRGAHIEEKREPINGWVSTEIEVVYLGPQDNTVPPDGKIDLNEDHPEEFFFVFRLVVGDIWTTHGQAVPYGKVWLNITRGHIPIQATISQIEQEWSDSPILRDSPTLLQGILSPYLLKWTSPMSLSKHVLLAVRDTLALLGQFSPGITESRSLNHKL